MVINVRGPEKSRRERNKSRTRNQLRDVALRLFREQGYEPTTIQQIADAADTAKATFFNYYLTKEHILGEFHSGLVQEIVAVYGRRSYRTTRRAVVELGRVAAQITESEPQLVAAVVRNLWGSPVLAEVDRSVGAVFTGVLFGILERGRAAGELRRDVDIETAGALIMSVLNGCVLDWVMADHEFNLPATTARRLTLLLKAFED